MELAVGVWVPPPLLLLLLLLLVVQAHKATAMTATRTAARTEVFIVFIVFIISFIDYCLHAVQRYSSTPWGRRLSYCPGLEQRNANVSLYHMACLK